MHIQNHAPVDRAGMHAREHVVDVLKSLGGDSSTHLTSTGEFKRLLQVETGANDRAPHRNAVQHHVEDRQRKAARRQSIERDGAAPSYHAERLLEGYSEK